MHVVCNTDWKQPLQATPCGLQGLSSQTRDQTLAPEEKEPSPNHWTPREFPAGPWIGDWLNRVIPLEYYTANKNNDMNLHP